MTSIILGAGYDMGDKIGNIITYVLLILAALVFIWVMYRYLNTEELNG